MISDRSDKMKAIAYDQDAHSVQLDKPVDIREFSNYMAEIYSEATGIPEVKASDMTNFFRHQLPPDDRMIFSKGHCSALG